MFNKKISTYLSPNALHLLALFFILVAGWIIRGSVLFSSDLIPGINGAYYPVQARAILYKGWLAIPDFPLLFYFQAFLGKLLSLFMTLEKSLLLSTQLTDTFFPVLLAIPVYLFSRAFDNQKESSFNSITATLIAGSIAVGSSSLLRMAGDFQKNAFGLPFFLFYAYFLYQSFKNRTQKNYYLAFFFFAMICLTHLGVTAMTLFFTFCFAGIHLSRRSDRKRMVVVVLSLLSILILSLIIISFYDPVRVKHILQVFLNPLRLFSGSVLIQWITGGGGGRPGEMEGFILGNFMGILGIYAMWKKQFEMDSETQTLLFSSSLCTLFFASPLIHVDLASRFGLMSFVPGLIVFTYWLIYHPKRRLIGIPIVLLVIIHTIPLSFRSQPVLNKEAYTELQHFKKQLPEGKKIALVRHGMEWWVAWTMEINISRNTEIIKDVWNQYDYVLTIEEKSGASMDRREPPSGRPPRPEDRPPRPEDHPSQPGEEPPEPGPNHGGPFFANQGPPIEMGVSIDAEFKKTGLLEGDYFIVNRLNCREKN